MGDDLYSAKFEGNRESVFELATEDLGRLERKCQKIEELEQKERNSKEVPF